MSDDRITAKGVVEITETDLDHVSGGGDQIGSGIDGEFVTKDHKGEPISNVGTSQQKVQPGNIRTQKV